MSNIHLVYAGQSYYPSRGSGDLQRIWRGTAEDAITWANGLLGTTLPPQDDFVAGIKVEWVMVTSINTHTLTFETVHEKTAPYRVGRDLVEVDPERGG